MASFTPSPFVFAVVVALLATGLPAVASAELYKYRTADGEILLTTEKRSDLKLVEVIDPGPRRSRRRASASKSSRPAPSTPSAPSASRSVAESGRSISELPWSEREAAFDDIIREAAATYDVPFGFIKGVIRVESAFKPDATSHAGAMGLMQLMPRTAASLNVRDPFDARQNIFGGAKFLRILIDRYDGDINLILAAYNAGDVAVARYEGIPYAKTRHYVASVYKWYRHYSASEGVD